MSTFQGDELENLYENPEPFSLFPEAGTTDPETATTPVSRRRHAVWLYRIIPACGLVAGIVGILWMADYLMQSPGADPFVFVEVRAIDPWGNTVSGARVTLGDRATGVTDSFGEWRRYLRLPPGAKVRLSVSKNSARGALSGRRNLVVPDKREDGRDAELRVRLRVSGAGAKKRPSRGFGQRKIRGKSGSVSPAHLHPGFRFESVKIRVRKLAGGSLTPRQEKYRNRVEQKVFSALRERADAFGLVGKRSKEEPWRLTLRYIPLRGRAGLIRVDVGWTWQGKRKSTSFLRNFSSRPEDTAADILEVARAHLPAPYRVYLEKGRWYVLRPEKSWRFWGLHPGNFLRNSTGERFPLEEDLASVGAEKRLALMNNGENPCDDGQGEDGQCFLRLVTTRELPPQQGWKKLRMQFTGPLPKNSSVYVSGFAARHAGDGIWKYWGQPGKQGRLTILRGHKVVTRRRITGRRQGVARVSMPKAMMARR